MAGDGLVESKRTSNGVVVLIGHSIGDEYGVGGVRSLHKTEWGQYGQKIVRRVDVFLNVERYFKREETPVLGTLWRDVHQKDRSVLLHRRFEVGVQAALFHFARQLKKTPVFSPHPSWSRSFAAVSHMATSSLFQSPGHFSKS